MEIFDANCPTYFAPNERQDYQMFLKAASAEYEVCEVDGQVLGALGLLDSDQNEKRLSWILLHPQAQGMGIGRRMMQRVIDLVRAASAPKVNIAASQRSAPFFEKFGATRLSFTRHGWGPGMDRVDMILLLR